MRRTAKTARRSLKENRLKARVTPEQKELIARAAALRGSSVKEFIVASAQEELLCCAGRFEIEVETKFAQSHAVKGERGLTTNAEPTSSSHPR